MNQIVFQFRSSESAIKIKAPYFIGKPQIKTRVISIEVRSLKAFQRELHTGVIEKGKLL